MKFLPVNRPSTENKMAGKKRDFSTDDAEFEIIETNPDFDPSQQRGRYFDPEKSRSEVARRALCQRQLKFD